MTPMKTPTVPTIGGTFKLANAAVPHRLIVAVDGLERQGKTHFALSAPGPLSYQSLDIGHEGVIEKFQSDKTIHLATYQTHIKKGMTAEAAMQLCAPVWEAFVEDYRLFLSSAETGKVRSGIIDTASDLWEVQRLARFGKLTQVMPHNYTALNQEYSQLIKEVYGTSANLILLHKLKAEWVENAATGKANKSGTYERSGFAGTGFLVQVNVLAWREMVDGDKKGFPTGPFHITIKDCRQNPTVAGMDLVEPFASFAHLGATVYPETSVEDWE
jgi:hypothetical protein